MSGLHPPRSPTSSPAPSSMATNNKVSARLSMGPQARAVSGNPASLALPSPRVGGQPGSARPTSELLVSGGASMFQTPEGKCECLRIIHPTLILYFVSPLCSSRGY